MLLRIEFYFIQPQQYQDNHSQILFFSNNNYNDHVLRWFGQRDIWEWEREKRERWRERDREIVLVNLWFYNFYHGMYHLNHCCVLTSLWITWLYFQPKIYLEIQYIYNFTRKILYISLNPAWYLENSIYLENSNSIEYQFHFLNKLSSNLVLFHSIKIHDPLRVNILVLLNWCLQIWT